MVRECLLAFDHFVTNKGVGLSKAVRGVLGTNMHDFARAHDQTAWRQASDVLRADPQARVEVAVMADNPSSGA
jgi:hypothetical protein